MSRHPPPPALSDAPLAPGLYVVPHADGTTAVGSTREPDWTDGAATDAGLEVLLASALRLAPALAGARVLARWAGVRPRAPITITSATWPSLTGECPRRTGHPAR